MTVQYTEKEYCKIEAVYTADPDIVKAKRQEAVSSMRTQKIKGFRKGKAPDWAISQHLKKEIDHWVSRELISVAHDEVIFETKIKPIGHPNVNKSSIGADKFSCELAYLKKPDFEIKEYKGFEIPKPHLDETKDELQERILQQFRESHSLSVPYQENDFVQKGDSITMDILCKVDGETVPDASDEGVLYKLENTYFPDFDENIIGMSAGEEREFKITFGEWAREGLKNKEGSFKAKVHMGMRKIPHALDNELAKKAAYETIEELVVAIAGMAQTQIETKEKLEIHKQITARLLANHDIKVPEWLSLMEAQQLARQNRTNWDELTDEERERYIEAGTKNVKLSLILDSIREEEPEALFTEVELIGALRKRLEITGQDPEKSIEALQKSGRLFGAVAGLREEATLEWVQNHCTIVEV